MIAWTLAAVIGMVVIVVVVALELVGVVLKVLVVRVNARALEEFRVLPVDEELLVFAAKERENKINNFILNKSK